MTKCFSPILSPRSTCLLTPGYFEPDLFLQAMADACASSILWLGSRAMPYNLRFVGLRAMCRLTVLREGSLRSSRSLGSQVSSATNPALKQRRGRAQLLLEMKFLYVRLFGDTYGPHFVG